MDRTVNNEHKNSFSGDSSQIIINNISSNNNNSYTTTTTTSNNEFNNSDHDATPHNSKQQQQQQQFLVTKAEKCTGCHQPITERYLLKVMNQSWHEDCLKCSCCNCRLGEVGSTLFTRANLMLCRRDYLRLFGATGFCSACSKPIPAFEMVMKAKDNVYHLDCFSCYHCNHRFCVGDRYYLIDNKIFCEVDFEERFPIPRLTSAIPSSSSSSSILSSNNNNNALIMNKTHPHLQLNHLPGHAHLLPQPIGNSQGPRLEVGQTNFGGR